jgi:hypothetical protein
MDAQEAQDIHDRLLRALVKKLDQKPCAACGALELTAAEANVIRQMLRDNEFRGIKFEASVKMRDVDDVPFPQRKAAHQ